MTPRPATFDVCIVGGGTVGTHLARLLVERGGSVAIVERGPRDVGSLRAPEPRIECVARVHGGSTNARNQILGGNAAFWGGGLMRTDAGDASGALGLTSAPSKENGDDLVGHFAEAERIIGLRHSLRRTPYTAAVDGLGPCALAEIGVLPGRARNIAATALDGLPAGASLRIYCNASNVVVEQPLRGGRVTAVTFQAEGAAQRVTAATFVIAAGPMDSNLFVASQARALGLADTALIGTALHDHWSVPLWRVRPETGTEILKAIAPTFEDGVIVGRHFELEAGSGWGARGFLHFTFHFDDVSPYRDIKHLLELRQRRASPLRIAGAAIGSASQIGRLLRVGYARIVERRLHISPAVPVIATLDFETYPSPENRVSQGADGRPMFAWDVRSEDVVSFMALADRARRLVTHLAQQHGAVIEPLVDLSRARAAEAHLRTSATDAYHLGGGLAVSATESDGVLDPRLRLRSIDNVFVASAAAFRRPGVVNPTLTLLALAGRLACDLERHGAG